VAALPSSAPRPLSPSTFTARLAYEVLMALDLDRDGCITARDAEKARASNLRFAVDFLLGPGVSVELASPEGEEICPGCRWRGCWSAAPRRCAG
jgi:hypothetical protein